MWRLTKTGPLGESNQVLGCLAGVKDPACCSLQVQLLHGIHYSVLHPCHVSEQV